MLQLRETRVRLYLVKVVQDELQAQLLAETNTATKVSIYSQQTKVSKQKVSKQKSANKSQQTKVSKRAQRPKQRRANVAKEEDTQTRARGFTASAPLKRRRCACELPPAGARCCRLTRFVGRPARTGSSAGRACSCHHRMEGTGQKNEKTTRPCKSTSDTHTQTATTAAAHAITARYSRTLHHKVTRPLRLRIDSDPTRARFAGTTATT